MKISCEKKRLLWTEEILGNFLSGGISVDDLKKELDLLEERASFLRRIMKKIPKKEESAIQEEKNITE